MDERQFIDFLGTVGKLKRTYRHNWTDGERRESVADHSWRLTLMAFLLRDEFPALDMQRVLNMCLVHDFGEAVTGDIPSFYKTESDNAVEENAVYHMLHGVPERQAELAGLFDEMHALETPEAKLYKALDKLEVVIAHNEAELSSWLPLERELNLTYGTDEADAFEPLRRIRAAVREQSERKLAEAER